ncbi:sigma-70 family RNA polymerase sigma factor [Kaistella daneshvariae]|jgi:RNA polymerase sigma-70 factor (ECF subfamily)|uniref:Sigma-70 family RNA polymerase sigma factor n=1 Tax=Kaistella daneshvariae TaxID=2487074 RepID=A0ABN5T1D8_9FLAO|nr:sigma-70 family RNA polymerase sigma factor [Kaistella daneshvariae]AZI67170.1 sigma-70 family RNA polymerase sigma factor [Kaistella daneshvariae]
MDTHTDSWLISAYKNGNEKALAVLIDRHQKDIFSYIFYKVMDDTLANDVFQDTFMKIIVTLKEGRYNEEGKFVLWAKRIAHNLIIDHYRLKAKHNKVSETSFDNEEYSIFDLISIDEENIEEQLISRQIQDDLLKILDYLPPNQQEVVKLRYFDSLSFKEIAEQTDTSINTTLGRVRYALINLRKIMEEHQISLTR